MAWRGRRVSGWHGHQRKRYANRVPDLQGKRLSKQAADEELKGQAKEEDVKA